MFVRTLTNMLCLPYVASADVAVPETYGAAMRWYERAAEDGNADAQYLLGLRYERGVEVASDKARAADLFRRAAEQGHAEAQFKLAAMLARGDGVAADPVAAARWYERAAVQGLAPAQYNLGVALLNGEGVTRDVDAALAWISLAAAADIAPAVSLRDRLLQVFPAERIEAGKRREAELRQKYAL